MAHADMPITYAIKDRGILLTPGSYSRAESLAALATVNLSSVTSVPTTILLGQRLDTTSLVMGNAGEQRARDMVGNMQAKVNLLHTANEMEADVVDESLSKE